MKRKWWGAILALMAVIALSLFCFRDALLVRLLPRAVLSGAITDSFQQLEQRFERSPIRMISNALDPQGRQNISMKLDTASEYMGAVHYSMDFHTQWAPNRILGTGTVSTGGGIMDLNLYLDENFAAISSQTLTEGNYYGLTYDTFAEDIRGFELIAFLIGEETLNGWEESMAGIQSAMERSYALPEFSSEDIRRALLGALTMKPRVEAGEGKGQYTVSFQAGGEELGLAARPYLEQLPEPLAAWLETMAEDEDSSVNVVFFLADRQLTKIQAAITCSEKTWQITANLGKDPSGGVLELEWMTYQDDNLDRTELTVTTVSDTERYQEGIRLKHTHNGVQKQLAADYTWDLSSGDMVLDLVLEGRKYPIRLNLTGEGEGFTLTTQVFERILSAITGKEKSESTICTLTVSPGEPLETVPEYRNLSDWSFEDLMLLLSRLGNLVGFKLA